MNEPPLEQWVRDAPEERARTVDAAKILTAFTPASPPQAHGSQPVGFAGVAGCGGPPSPRRSSSRRSGDCNCGRSRPAPR